MSFPIAAAVGALAGVLTAFGVGGGSLILLCLSVFTDMEQSAVTGVGLIFFLATALSALPMHVKSGQIDREAALPTLIAGVVAGGAAAFLAGALDTGLMRKFFGGLLILIGLNELFFKKKKNR